MAIVAGTITRSAMIVEAVLKSSCKERRRYCPICDKEVTDMEKRTIWVKSSCFAPEFEMIIPIPTDRDDEEYIDELLDGMLSTELRYNVEWDFVDGLS